MDRFGNPFPRPHEREAPASPATPPRLDGWTRLLIVGLAMALIVFFGWPPFKAELSEIGRQMSHTYGNHSGVAPSDPFGLRGERPGPVPRQRADRDPPQRDNPQPRRWRMCKDDNSECGPWHDGPPPEQRGRR
jgi:hypothetical protein